MSKIIFSDLDGTLLSDDKSISQKNRQAIQDLLDEGHYFVICTGRPVASGREVAKELGLTSSGCYMVCFNGAVVYDCAADQVLKRNSVPFNYMVHIFEEAQKAGIYVQTYNETDVIALSHTKELDYYVEHSKMSYKVVNNLYDAMDMEPQKVLLVELEDKQRLLDFKNKLEPWSKDKLNAFFSCEEYLEFCPKGIDKGAGVTYLSEFLNIPLSDVIAVGDERNDIPMLEKAGLGIAMKNAQEDVFPSADYVTEANNNEDAIAEVIYKFVLKDKKP